ncbi:segregation and condensation protein B [Elusimicrobium posterum]|uniref:SMC-Scp complex subunit ScpB n=1 Tax=Elusimicrobium posterum TaxID=3116653 RepID=UPI003C72B315
METNNDMLISEDAKKIIENLLFITDRPLTTKRIAEVVESVDSAQALEIISQLQKEYTETGRAVQIVELGGGFQMSTKPEYGRWVRKLYNEKMTAKLSNAALETLAIVAYKQPVTRAEMEAIRGVDVAGPLEKLLERGLVRILGKRDTIGKPMVYGTTDEFLRLFGLNKVSDLPDMEIFAAKIAPVDAQSDLPFDGANASNNIIPLDEDDAEGSLEAAEALSELQITSESETIEDTPVILETAQEILDNSEILEAETEAGISEISVEDTEEVSTSNTGLYAEDDVEEELPAQETSEEGVGAAETSEEEKTEE